jgi:all-trans-retinol 13,14-reductase
MRKSATKTLAQAGSGPWDVIVIGSGMGGMACAAALSLFGRKVLVLEQHYVAGGFTHVFSRKGFDWDVGVHCVGEMGTGQIPGNLIRWLSRDTVRWNTMGDVYERFEFPDGFKFEFPSTREGFREALKRAFPHDGASVDRYFDACRQVARTAPAFFATRALPEWAGKLGGPVLKRPLERWWKRTTAQVLEELIVDPKLRALITAQWGYYGSTPTRSSFAIHALTMTHFLTGGYYPEGGASTIADGMLDTVSSAGGEALVRAPVERVLVERGRAVGVRMADGREFRAPIVVSAAGARATVSRLLPEELRDSVWARDVAKIGQSPPHVCMYLGLEGDLEGTGASRANKWFFETWDMEASSWDVNDPKSKAPVLYVSFPSLKDPRHDPGPQNRNTAEVVTFVPWEAFSRWTDTRRGFRNAEYNAFKKGIEDRMLAQLRRHAPKLMERVKYHELSTPLSTVHFTRAPEGAIYGLEATPARFLSKALRTRTAVRGLYLAGGDVATLGVTGALVGGVLAAASIEPRVFLKLR